MDLMAKTKRQRRVNWGDPDFEGNGNLTCHICSGLLKDHPIARTCPYPFDPERFTKGGFDAVDRSREK